MHPYPQLQHIVEQWTARHRQKETEPTITSLELLIALSGDAIKLAVATIPTSTSWCAESSGTTNTIQLKIRRSRRSLVI